MIDLLHPHGPGVSTRGVCVAVLHEQECGQAAAYHLWWKDGRRSPLCLVHVHNVRSTGYDLSLVARIEDAR